MDEYEYFYRLSPISNETLKLVLEAWKIWCRWLKTSKHDKTVLKYHPALPEEQARHKELQSLLDGLRIIDESNFEQANGVFFEKDTGKRSPMSGCSVKLVKWEVLINL